MGHAPANPALPHGKIRIGNENFGAPEDAAVAAELSCMWVH